MYEEVSAYEQDIKFTVGFAGSGKSTELAKEADDRALVLTPTHKARNVLEDKGVENVFTIHAVLKLVPKLNQNARKGQKLQTLKRVGSVELDEIDTVIIDEFSMINTTILDLLLELLPEECTVHLFGDPFQLKPVDGDVVDPLDYADAVNIVELTKQHRADSKNVVDSFMRFMQFIKDGSCKDLTLDNLPTITEKELAKRFNPSSERIIAYTNQRVVELNSLIKAPALQTGDNILINGLEATVYSKEPSYDFDDIYPAMISKGGLNLVKRHEIEANLTKYGGWDLLNPYDQLVVSVEGSFYNLRYDLEHYFNNKGYEQDVKDMQELVTDKNNLGKEINLPKWCRANQSGVGVKRRGQAWKEYISHTSNIFDLRYPYATTVYKAQGQEFDTVYIDQDNMKKAIRNGHIDSYTRMMYVGISRAIKNVYIIQN